MIYFALHQTMFSWHSKKKKMQKISSLEHLNHKVAYKKMDSMPYDNDIFNDILSQYQNEISDGFIAFPIKALQCIDTLRKMADGKMLLLLSDKGFTSSAEHIRHQNHNYLETVFASHTTLSLAVNFDAIGSNRRILYIVRVI